MSPADYRKYYVHTNTSSEEERMVTTTLLSKVMDEFPQELRTPMWHFTELLEERFVIPHQDFSALKLTVHQLAQAQKRTEQRVEQLAQAQERTEQAVASLADSIKNLQSSMYDQFARLGSRWGLQTESTFRQTIRRIVRDMDGLTVREGFYGGRQVDVVIRNGEHILLEITSSMKSSDIDKLYAFGHDYLKQEGVDPTLMVAASYIPPSVMRKVLDLPRPIEIFSYEENEDED
ncbi:hypothetical protein CSB45_02615 [candidate division KSB3 bacterium]|uniref:DUF3782 domain-containing protein n=1 Tax=candidate division KSB3 bacterium TaxID=2044937 RepID=A0A2G6EAW0_9BACT|nr:MAG: hypothetical protein CSB45_02615 [candidate division KSB3 bacterium]